MKITLDISDETLLREKNTKLYTNHELDRMRVTKINYEVLKMNTNFGSSFDMYIDLESSLMLQDSGRFVIPLDIKGYPSNYLGKYYNNDLYIDYNLNNCIEFKNDSDLKATIILDRIGLKKRRNKKIDDILKD